MNFKKVKVRDQVIDEILEITELHYKKEEITEKELKGLLTAILIKYGSYVVDFEIYRDNKMQEAEDLKKDLEKIYE